MAFKVFPKYDSKSNNYKCNEKIFMTSSYTFLNQPFDKPTSLSCRFKVKAEKEALILLSGIRNYYVRKSYTVRRL